MPILLNSSGHRTLNGGILLGAEGDPCCCDKQDGGGTSPSSCYYCDLVGKTTPIRLKMTYTGITLCDCVESSRFILSAPLDLTIFLANDAEHGSSTPCEWYGSAPMNVWRRIYASNAECQAGGSYTETLVSTQIKAMYVFNRALLYFSEVGLSGAFHQTFEHPKCPPTTPQTFNNWNPSCSAPAFNQFYLGTGGTVTISRGW